MKQYEQYIAQYTGAVSRVKRNFWGLAELGRLDPAHPSRACFSAAGYGGVPPDNEVVTTDDDSRPVFSRKGVHLGMEGAGRMRCPGDVKRVKLVQHDLKRLSFDVPNQSMPTIASIEWPRDRHALICGSRRPTPLRRRSRIKRIRTFVCCCESVVCSSCPNLDVLARRVGLRYTRTQQLVH